MATSCNQSAATRSMVVTRRTVLTCISGGERGDRGPAPVPWKKFVEAMSRMHRDARQDVGQPSLRIDAVHLGR